MLGPKIKLDKSLHERLVAAAQKAGYSSTDEFVTHVLERAVAVPGCEVETRAGIYVDLQETLTEERPVDFLLAPNQHLLVGERLQGIEPGPFAPFTWNVTDWYLSEE